MNADFQSSAQRRPTFLAPHRSSLCSSGNGWTFTFHLLTFSLLTAAVLFRRRRTLENYREHTGAIPSACFLWMFRDQVVAAGGRNTFYLLLGEPKASPGRRDYFNPVVHFGFTAVPLPSWMTLGIPITYANNLKWLLSFPPHFQRSAGESAYLRS